MLSIFQELIDVDDSGNQLPTDPTPLGDTAGAPDENDEAKAAATDAAAKAKATAAVAAAQAKAAAAAAKVEAAAKVAKLQQQHDSVPPQHHLVGQPLIVICQAAQKRVEQISRKEARLRAELEARTFEADSLANLVHEQSNTISRLNACEFRCF